MKIFFFFLLLICVEQNVLAQYTLVPDPVFEDFLETNGMGDGVPDNGQVLTANIESVTGLDVTSFLGVTDLTGIEDFTALDFLNVAFNDLTQLDLSQNTELRVFGCRFNSLTSLDLSNNTKLEYLAAESNNLTSLILNSDYLTIIECNENQLTSLDVSQCPALINLNCSINGITSLDISQNTELEVLTCWANGLSGLDTSNNLLLRYLGCSDNGITNLDLSQNINLEALLALYNSLLSYLDLRNGNNANMTVNTFGTDDLQCIFVDDSSAPYLDDWFKDPFTTFVNNEAECDALGVESFTKDSWSVYPNPAKDYIFISSQEPLHFVLTSANGIQVKTGEIGLGLSKISLVNLSNGLYFIITYTKDTSSAKKIIKQ
jgi:hypothetical protein